MYHKPSFVVRRHSHDNTFLGRDQTAIRRRYNTANSLELLIPTHFRAEKRCCLDYEDYVATCESVLPILQQFQRSDQQAGIIGVFIDALIRAVLPDISADIQLSRDRRGN